MRKCFSALIFVLSILISASCSWASLEFLGEDLTDGYVGEYYSDFLVVDGKRGTITWSGGGGLPPGLSMNGNGDVVYITGTPTTEGFYTFTIRATDSIVGSAVAYCSIIIDKLSVSITSSFSTGIKNTSYSSSVKAKYGTAPYTWSNEGGEIPPGLTLSFSGDEAKLSGTPTKDGLYTLKLKVTDKTGATYSRECSVVIRPLEISGKFTESTMELDTYSDNGVKVVGGTAPFTWNVIEGTLPPGLKVTSSGSNALLSGTPTEEGRYTFTLEVSDAEGKTATKSFTVSVNGMYIDGKNYDITGITAKNATLPVTWKLIRGFLPLGLSLPSSSGDKCVISGTAIPYSDNGTDSYTSVSYKFTLLATDAKGRTAEKDFSVSVSSVSRSNVGAADKSFTISNSLYNIKTNPYKSLGYKYDHYFNSLGAVGGRASYEWSVTDGSLPKGITTSIKDGETATLWFEGDPPDDSYADNEFAVKLVDADGRSMRGKFNIKAPNGLSGGSSDIEISETDPVISGDFLTAFEGMKYQSSVTASGGVPPYKWEIVRYEMPSWAVLSSSDKTGKYAVLKGTPTDGGRQYAFTLKVTDSRGNTNARDFILPVTPPLTVTGKLPSGVRRNQYVASIRANGGLAPYTWSVSSGVLPDGLDVKASGDLGVISGKPSKAGQYSFTLKATDKNGMTFERAMSVNVTQTEVAGTLVGATRRSVYSARLNAIGGTSPYVWSVSSGKLPDGLTISASGDISGTATKAGTFKFTVKAKDSNGAAGTKEYTVKVTQTAVSGTIPATTTRKATFTATPKASGGATPYIWSISAGKLPDGLTLNASTGKITGSATKAGTFSFTVKAKDKNGAAGSKAYTVKVTQTAVSGTLPTTTTRRAIFTATPKATGGATPYTWSISAGKLPDGLTINASTGKISGSATKAGTFSFTLKAKDKNGAAGTKAYTVKVTQTAVAGSLSSGTKGTSYTGALKASGGASPYVWSVSAGSLPDSLKIDSSTGKITGTPTKTGTFTFTIKAKDSNGAAGTKSYTVKVTASTTTAKSALSESKPGAKNAAGVSAQERNSVSALPSTPSATFPEADGITSVNLPASLRVKSDDLIESFSGKDSDIVIVKAGMPVTFILGAEISGAAVYVDDKPAEGVEISDEGTFILPAEFVREDFKVCVKSSDGITESEELYITAE